MLKVAVAKGRVAEKVGKLLDTSDYSDIIDLDSRKLIFEAPERGIVFFMVKPADVPVYVGSGAADIGIIGKDVLMENREQAYEILDLMTCGCKMVVAGPSNDINGKTTVKRVATKYPRITEEYFKSKSEAVEIIKLEGSIELAPLVGLSDVIVDIVESGRTLKENGLVVYEEICSITARMIVNRVSYKLMNTGINTFAAAVSVAVKGGQSIAEDYEAV